MSYNGSSLNKQHNYVDDEIHQENPYGRNRNIRSKYARFNNPCNATEYQPQLRQNNHQHFNPSHNHIHNNPRFNNNQHRTNSNNANNFFNNHIIPKIWSV